MTHERLKSSHGLGFAQVSYLCPILDRLNNPSVQSCSLISIRLSILCRMASRPSRDRQRRGGSCHLRFFLNDLEASLMACSAAFQSAG